MRQVFLFLVFCFQLQAQESFSKLIDTQKAQEFQADFDVRFFEVNDGFEKLRHILLHLMKSVGKVATYCEAVEHGENPDVSALTDKITPDLLFHALQLANFFELDLSTKYEERIAYIIQKAAESAREGQEPATR